jgi:hypothetical protein
VVEGLRPAGERVPDAARGDASDAARQGALVGGWKVGDYEVSGVSEHVADQVSGDRGVFFDVRAVFVGLRRVLLDERASTLDAALVVAVGVVLAGYGCPLGSGVGRRFWSARVAITAPRRSPVQAK